ncbi:hypothetical protein OHS58_37295 [Amycolatopsis sp. NBC_00348]|uniref:hypothetical protein n=1 Tax=Amycolatopsis sp. NBC_00348 TaxID=2975956 RepID=UPI002E25AA23
MGRLAFPDGVPEGPLRALLIELHLLHARAGHPSLDEMRKRQNSPTGDRFGRDAIHRLFSSCRETPKLPLLLEVVRILASMAPTEDVDAVLDRFDRLWLSAERYDALGLGQGFLYDGIEDNKWSGDSHV